MDREGLRQFFAAIQPSMGYRCFTRPRGEKRGFREWWAGSIDGLLDLYESVPKTTLYHTVNSFSDKRRIKENACLFKSTYLEIDFDIPGIRPKPNAYKTMEQFLEALGPIEKEIGQEGLIVASGGGAHVYYPYHEPVEGDLWWSDTNYILSLYKRYGCKGVDSGCGRDKSRVLRTPGGVNEKYNKAVSILRLPSGFREPKWIPHSTIGFSEADQQLQDRRYRHITREALVSVCSHFRRFENTPNDLSYNEWLGCLTGFRRIPNGDQIALELSRKDLRYQTDEYIIEKLDSLTGTDAQTCETFLGLDPAKSPCNACAFKGKGLNPLKAALRTIQQTIPIVEPSDMPIPQGYTLQGAAIHVGEKGNKIESSREARSLVSNTPYYVKGLYADPITSEQTILFGYQRPFSKVWAEVSIPQNKCLVNGGTYELAKVVNLTDRLTKGYISSSLKLYQELAEERGIDMMLPLVKQIGWIKDAGKYTFLYGKRIINDKGLLGETVHLNTDARLNTLVASVAPLDKNPEKEEALYREWQQLAWEYVGDETVPVQCKIMFLLGFVAPVVRLCVDGYRIGGLVINVCGPSNTGKTTALRAAAGIWGKPGAQQDFGLIPPIDVSEAAAYHNFGLTPNLPCFIDEFTSSKMFQNVRGVHDFIKAFSDGASPGRMNQDNTQRAQKYWNTLCLCTSNEPLSIQMRNMEGHEDSLAAEMRFIEMWTPGPVPFSNKYDRFSQLYGLAGPRWIRHLCQERVQQSLLKWCDTHEEASLPPKARFIRKVIALVEWTANELWRWHDSEHQFIDSDCAGIVWFPGDLVEWLREHQRKAVEEAEAVRKLSVMEICVLQLIHEDREKLITFEGLPVGDYTKMTTAEARRCFTPVGAAASAVYQRGNASHCYVKDKEMYYIPHEALRAIHGRRVKTRSFTADLQQMLLAHPIRVQRGLHLGGMAGIDRPPLTCYGFSNQLIEAWRALDSGRGED